MPFSWKTMGSWRLAALWLALLPLISVPGASAEEIDPSLMGRPTRLVVYDGGHIVRDQAIVKDSREERALNAWLQAHKGGWKRSIHSYAPHRHIIGENYTIDFSDNLCVLNYRLKNGRGRHLTMKIRKDDPIPDVFSPRK